MSSLHHFQTLKQTIFNLTTTFKQNLTYKLKLDKTVCNELDLIVENLIEISNHDILTIIPILQTFFTLKNKYLQNQYEISSFLFFKVDQNLNNFFNSNHAQDQSKLEIIKKESWKELEHFISLHSELFTRPLFKYLLDFNHVYDTYKLINSHQISKEHYKTILPKRILLSIIQAIYQFLFKLNIINENEHNQTTNVIQILINKIYPIENNLIQIIQSIKKLETIPDDVIYFIILKYLI